MAEEHSVKVETEYAVLRFDGVGSWAFTDSIVARSAEAAVKQAASAVDGVYVAVPSRSWKPLKVTTKTETTLVVEDAPSEEAT